MTSDVVAGLNVSRETLADLRAFAALTEKWTRKINLIAPSTIPDIWDRHIVDSAQIFTHAPPNATRWADLGSGGGFPGIVVAILAKATHPNCDFTLIESDQRKATFLRTAARELDLRVTVQAKRIDATDPQNANVVSARALSSLPALIPLIQRHQATDGIALLHKGQTFARELIEARQNWHFDLTEYPSITDPNARILAIKGITRV